MGLGVRAVRCPDAESDRCKKIMRQLGAGHMSGVRTRGYWCELTWWGVNQVSWSAEAWWKVFVHETAVLLHKLKFLSTYFLSYYLYLVVRKFTNLNELWIWNLWLKTLESSWMVYTLVEYLNRTFKSHGLKTCTLALQKSEIILDLQSWPWDLQCLDIELFSFFFSLRLYKVTLLKIPGVCMIQTGQQRKNTTAQSVSRRHHGF